MSEKVLKKKNIVLTLAVLILLIVLILLVKIAYDNIYNQCKVDICNNFILKFAEENENEIFSIDKIVYFSS